MKSKQDYIQFFKYGLVGVANTLTDFAVFAAMYGLFDINVYLSNVIAYFVAVTQSYIVNKMWTFAHDGRLFDIKMFSRFILVNIACLGISTLVLFLTKSYMSPYLGKVVAAFFVVIYGFIANKYFVFSNTAKS